MFPFGSIPDDSFSGCRSADGHKMTVAELYGPSMAEVADVLAAIELDLICEPDDALAKRIEGDA